jgi:hypothetical protein
LIGNDEICIQAHFYEATIFKMAANKILKLSMVSDFNENWYLGLFWSVELIGKDENPWMQFSSLPINSSLQNNFRYQFALKLENVEILPILLAAILRIKMTLNAIFIPKKSTNC